MTVAVKLNPNLIFSNYKTCDLNKLRSYILQLEQLLGNQTRVTTCSQKSGNFLKIWFFGKLSYKRGRNSDTTTRAFVSVPDLPNICSKEDQFVWVKKSVKSFAHESRSYSCCGLLRDKEMQIGKMALCSLEATLKNSSVQHFDHLRNGWWLSYWTLC